MVSKRVAAQRRRKRQAALRRSKISRATRKRAAKIVAAKTRRATRKRAPKVVARAKAMGISIRALSKLKAVRPVMPYIKPKAPAVIAKEVTGISGKLKLIPGLIIGSLIAAYMLLKRK